MRMMVPELPIGWSDHGSNGPMTLIGMREWQDVTVSAHFKLPAKNPAGKGTSLSGVSLQVVFLMPVSIRSDVNWCEQTYGTREVREGEYGRRTET